LAIALHFLAERLWDFLPFGHPAGKQKSLYQLAFAADSEAGEFFKPFVFGHARFNARGARVVRKRYFADASAPGDE
jgi:hypothetical protein